MMTDQPNVEGAEAEVIAAHAEMAEAVKQDNAAKDWTTTGLQGCGSTEAREIRDFERQSTDRLRRAQERLFQAEARYLEVFGSAYVPPQPEGSPLSAKHRPDIKTPGQGLKKTTKRRSGRRAKGQWKQR